jgi:hypothetical protein
VTRQPVMARRLYKRPGLLPGPEELEGMRGRAGVTPNAHFDSLIYEIK